MLIEFLTLVLILPCLASYLPQSFRSLRSFRKEKYLAEGSIVALFVGGIFLGFAPTVHLAIAGVIILALGTGQDSLLRSMATELAPKSDISIVYSAVTMLRAIGGSVSGPLYAQLYSSGLKSHTSGLPFMTSAALFALALVLCMTVTDGETNDDDKTNVEERRETEPLLN
jgi:MFS family permease